MTTQQPTIRQGANAWKMGTNKQPYLPMGFFLCLSMGNYYIGRYFYAETSKEVFGNAPRVEQYGY